ncbi:Retrotransposon-derived protein peg10 [Entomophthora muscae]|uniref:Retrotransposon-derived protein peg10 n=1 Tax=Entomophthora muscae TaxID=34485 RepID=A0ACC2UI77_9FUNG|nr:Retrotransposon-derived protein peg10 [Entomophthora muscae]
MNLIKISFFTLLEGHTPTSYTNQTVVLNTLAHSSPPLAYFTSYRSEFSTNSQKVLYLVEKFTSHYRDWFSSHSIHNPGILQNYNLFVSSLLSFSGEDKDTSTPSASCFAGLTQGLLPLREYNRKFCSLQSRLHASDAEACSFYKIGLNRLLQEFLVHHNLPNELEPLIREVVNLVVCNRQGTAFFNPSTWHQAKVWGRFCLTAKEVLRRRNNNLFSHCGSKDHLLPACPISKYFPFINKTSTLTLLSLIDTSKSPTVLVTIHGPLGKIKVLALLNTGANANFIEEKLAKFIGLPASGSLDVKVGNSTIIGVTPILQSVTIDLEGFSFHVTCNSSPQLILPVHPWISMVERVFA